MSEPKRLSLDELRATREYARLTERQKVFVDVYCSGKNTNPSIATDSKEFVCDPHNAVVATLFAYTCKNEEVARIMSYALMANIRIVEVLDRYFGASPVESFLKALDRAIHNKKLTIAQLQALKLKCDVMGFASGIPAGHFGAGDIIHTKPVRVPAVKPKTPKKTKKEIVKPPPSSHPEGSSYDFSQFENKTSQS